MCTKQDRPRSVLANKPSLAASFASISSAASATSAASSRTGCSKLLFGEIDTHSDRSADSYASVCSFVLCDSGTFLRFWLDDQCRHTFLSFVPQADLARLRLACHDFSARAAPALFNDLKITFRTSTFTKPAKLAALDRLGSHVKALRFDIPHTRDTVLPPLVDPDTGDELSFTYTPQVQPLSSRRPKYGDRETTDILNRQYPALFHAATNVPAFGRAVSAFVNLERLSVACPGYDASTRYRRSAVDFALISLRIAMEQNGLQALRSLTLAPIHPGGLLYLSPLIGYGASPRSVSRWASIEHLTIHSTSLPRNTPRGPDEPDHMKLLQTYLRNFQANLTTFDFRWIGVKGPLPIQRPTTPAPINGQHPAHRGGSMGPPERPTTKRRASDPLQFPKVKHVEVENISCSATDISAFVATHKRTLEEFNLEDVSLTSGTWDEALAPLTRPAQSHRRDEVADIPIMLSPTAAAVYPMPMERVESVRQGSRHRSMRLSKWLPGRKSRSASTRKARDGLLGYEEPLKRVLGGVLPWR
ncbi:hypothetical protein Tdes44962_MAKER08737 [Teratosphaeria destructans]|uniref:Uncharacterized protein n=1 Tax=Teratosphaeria destructans TaxID=418781 RepID=A0A9W7SVT8_9PEZI|nr:hypothetical protein Tdes44962_MAKER08737 [Teratosphaeria destructans]